MLETLRGFGSGLFVREAAPLHPEAVQGESKTLGFLLPTERRRLEDFLAAGNVLALIYLEVESFQVFGDIYGGLVAHRIQEIVQQELEGLRDEALTDCRVHYVEALEPGRFVLLCGDERLEDEYLSDLVLSIRLRLRSRVKQEALNLTGQSLNVLAGYGLFDRAPAGLGDAVFGALSDARRVAAGTLDVTKLSLLKEFREIVSDRLIRSVYQPIVDLETGGILAWEALARGPEGSHFQFPAVLFDFAEEVDQVFSLEKACRESAIHHLGTIGPEQKLFLNVHPKTLVDPAFSPGQTLRLLEKSGLAPSDVVLEITERHSVRDFALFHRTLDHYRSQGFQVAVDDVGTGYSGLWSIAEIRPDYLKVDMSLVREIDHNPVKRALMETPGHVLGHHRLPAHRRGRGERGRAVHADAHGRALWAGLLPVAPGAAQAGPDPGDPGPFLPRRARPGAGPQAVLGDARAGGAGPGGRPGHLGQRGQGAAARGPGPWAPWSWCAASAPSGWS